MNSLKEKPTLILLRTKLNLSKEDFSISNMRLMDYLKEKSNSQLRMSMVEKDSWTTPDFLMKNKLKLLNSKRKSKTQKKDSEELLPDKLNLKTKSLPLELKIFNLETNHLLVINFTTLFKDKPILKNQENNLKL